MIHERFKTLRKELGLTQQEFAERINLRRNSIAQIELGYRNPSGAVLALICKTFNVNETWLRTGEGEMRLNLDRKEELTAIFAQIAASDDAKARLVKAFAMLPDEAYPKLEEYIKKIAQELSKE